MALLEMMDQLPAGRTYIREHTGPDLPAGNEETVWIGCIMEF